MIIDLKKRYKAGLNDIDFQVGDVISVSGNASLYAWEPETMTALITSAGDDSFGSHLFYALDTKNRIIQIRQFFRLHGAFTVWTPKKRFNIIIDQCEKCVIVRHNGV